MSKDGCCILTSPEEEALAILKQRLDGLIAKGGEVHFKKGHVLFYEGHSPYGFFVLKKGEITLSRPGMNGTTKYFPLKNGNILGLFHLVTNIPHCATATAKTDVEGLFVPKSVVLEFLESQEAAIP